MWEERGKRKREGRKDGGKQAIPLGEVHIKKTTTFKSHIRWRDSFQKCCASLKCLKGRPLQVLGCQHIPAAWYTIRI